jgi:serine/threonine protein kinase
MTLCGVRLDLLPQVFSELELMTTMGSHTNLVSLQGACETPSSWILIMDLADGGTLFDRIVEHDCLNEALASDYILQVPFRADLLAS